MTDDVALGTGGLLADEASLHLMELAEAMRSLSVDVEASDDSSLERLVETAAAHIPGVRWASVTTLRAGRFRTEASSDPAAARADAVQYDVGAGPCVDAALEEHVLVVEDLEHDGRWPEFAARAREEVGVAGVLAYRLTLQSDSPAIACLNAYSDTVGAVDEASVATGLVLATHASLLVSAVLDRERAHHLERALRSNREIGVAMGVLMQRHGLSREQAFDVLRVASQDSNRKLADLAVEVADTGTIALRRWPSSVPRRE